MSKQIGNDKYVQLVGLLTIANFHTRRVDEVKLAACEVLGIGDEGGTDGDHVGDAIWGNPTDDPVASVRQLLDRLGVEVLK
jgi:hypothetical protein